MFKRCFAVLLFVACAFDISHAAGRFPQAPEESATPGSLCDNPDDFRYPEHIAYCERNVQSQTKAMIIDRYDRDFGYSINQMDRNLFKIDHYIPLCMGGSNEVDNLWPQHISIFEATDPLEQIICEKMAQGVLKQKRAVEFIRKAKADIDNVEAVLEEVSGL